MTNHKPINDQLKRCEECHAHLPVSHYGRSKTSSDGLYRCCKACTNGLAKYQYTLKVGRDHAIYFDTNTRIVRLHNKYLIKHALSNLPTSIYGFVPHTNKAWVISFGPSASISTYDSVKLTGLNDETLSYEYAYDRRDPNVADTLHSLMKSLSIRLEHSESDMFDSKQSIYYIGIL